MRGENNPNFRNKSRRDPEVEQRLRDACKRRGQCWTEEHRKAHSERMKGPSNAMRGNKHTDEFKKRMSAIKSGQYERGEIKISGSKISRNEKEIAAFLEKMGVEFVTQFHIKGLPYNYDFYIPECNLIVEFQGNYWHANPKIYRPGMLLRVQRKGLTPVESIWERDFLKKSAAERSGYRVVYFWESDYKTSGVEFISTLIRQ